MLLANKEVAEAIGKVPKGKKSRAFVYRVHDVPDPEKLDTLNTFILRFGHKIKQDGTKTEIAKSINSLLDKVQGRPEENLVETIAIRTMSKAIYSTNNVGHYGLAFDYYTHFTSPIRRYPDMLVHRLVERYLDGGRSVEQVRWKKNANTVLIWNRWLPMPSVTPLNTSRLSLCPIRLAKYTTASSPASPSGAYMWRSTKTSVKE